MDSPARSSWLNTKHFNGYNGCSTCTEPGEQLDLGQGKKNARRQCHIYPFNKEFAQTTGHAKLSTHDVVKHQALVAMSQISERGKVYVSILFDIARTCSLFCFALNRFEYKIQSIYIVHVHVIMYNATCIYLWLVKLHHLKYLHAFTV